MKTKNLFGLSLLLLLLTGLVSCNDDDIKDPDDAVTLNMLNEKNGKTFLGTSDVFINSSNNFQTSSCYIADAGLTSGLGANVAPQLNNLTREAAVVAGHFYQIYERGTLQSFPSGNSAILIGSGYYKMYVLSPITNGDVASGAIVKYVLAYPDAKNLPEYREVIGRLNGVGETFEYVLPKNAEYMLDDYWNEVEGAFDIQTAGNKLSVTLLKPVNTIYGPYGTHKIYIRLGHTYTVVDLNVGMDY